MEIARHWRLRRQNYNLVGEICPNPNCRKFIFPPRDICPGCGNKAKIDPNDIPKTIFERDKMLARTFQDRQI